MFRLLLLALVLAAIVYIVWPSYTFRVVFRQGSIDRVRGQAPGNLRSAFSEIADLSKLTGTVGLKRGGKLTFSEGIPEPDRQRFRNVVATML